MKRTILLVALSIAIQGLLINTLSAEPDASYIYTCKKGDVQELKVIYIKPLQVYIYQIKLEDSQYTKFLSDLGLELNTKNIFSDIKAKNNLDDQAILKRKSTILEFKTDAEHTKSTVADNNITISHEGLGTQSIIVATESYNAFTANNELLKADITQPTIAVDLSVFDYIAKDPNNKDNNKINIQFRNLANLEKHFLLMELPIVDCKLKIIPDPK